MLLNPYFSKFSCAMSEARADAFATVITMEAGWLQINELAHGVTVSLRLKRQAGTGEP
ncbi:MAG: hypothetical protein AVDCRST_MAG86-2722 [uncultured Truepera sp.]|uniref:Uncharacterized protein n=1 Tax=uncultured Truepera sp. TaxID=543023 RepID=A0A6J4VR52_9DEIN|nr:MAG: hypothetical protein AVDCRST_MAG86-2722 [uncultured Truepera sp.]